MGAIVMSERELPEGVSRKQIRSIAPVRQYILEQTKGSNQTVSQYLKEVFPDNWEEVQHGYPEEEIVRIKLTPEVDGMIDHMTGGRFHKGEVIAFYCLVDALERGEEVEAEELIEYVPEMLWEQLEGQL